MTVVAIHQPNYLPWLGYFHKIAQADVFVFLDDVQFSKNSFTNRVKVMSPGGPKWLTQPVSFHFGDPIGAVRPARPDWAAAHLETLRQYYRKAPAFRAVHEDLAATVGALPGDADLAAINRALVEAVAGRLGLTCRFVTSSSLALAGDVASDDRLVEIVAAVAPGGAYLSGKGGAKYQDPDKFAAAGLGFRYTDFAHPVYDQGRASFEPGLSILDAAYRLGWAGAARLLAGDGAAA